ncbi:MAG: aromatic ring-hydroxylating dioxygenase subunit alpha [Pseudomonadota bacterium]
MAGFIENCWYVAAWDHELTTDGLFARTVCALPLVMWRDAAGQPVALEDRCCHRGAPLSLGRREGDCVRCMYHGLKFDATGACVQVPGMDSVPPKVRVRQLPCVLRHRWVWVWPGDPALADPALIPDTHWLDEPGWACTPPGYMHYAVNHRLINDNLLDFSHLAYVHQGTLGGSEAYAQLRPEIERLPRGLRITRWQFDIAPAPFIAKVKHYPGNVDRWNIYEFLLPGILIMDSGFAPTGSGAQHGLRTDAVEFRSCQAVTPETENTSHYFFAQPRNFAHDDEAVNRSLHESLVAAFEEDRAIITAQARAFAPGTGFVPLPLWMDGALVQFRRMEDAARGEPG